MRGFARDAHSRGGIIGMGETNEQLVEAVLRLVNPSTPLRFAGGRRDMSDETAAKCIYVGMSAGIAGPLLTTPGADFDDDRSLAVRAGFSVGQRLKN